MVELPHFRSPSPISVLKCDYWLIFPIKTTFKRTSTYKYFGDLEYIIFELNLTVAPSKKDLAREPVCLFVSWGVGEDLK